MSSTITIMLFPEKIKRHYLSILNIKKVESKPIRTKKYYFIKKLANRQDIKN
jgi:hypothetical protein